MLERLHRKRNCASNRHSGRLTTSSSYILEVVNHFLSGRVGLGLLDLFLHNVLCLVCIVLGLWLGRFFS
jgi:fluoride ion exporter CrcB/FEX